jgi:hypothetical protein
MPQDDPCSHPITPQQWGRHDAHPAQIQQLGDSLTRTYILVVFGSGPYPKCLYQSVRDYFVAVAGATPAELELADRRREHAEALMRTLLNAR